MAVASIGADSAKRSGMSVMAMKDGRLQFNLSMAATLSLPKIIALGAVALLCALYLLAPFFGIEGMRRRVLQLEQRMAQKLHWVLRNREHIATDLALDAEVAGAGGRAAEAAAAGGAAAALPLAAALAPPKDGRRHLLTPPGAISKLAAALAPETALADFDDHYLCGRAAGFTEAAVMRKTIALAAISWKAPRSLRNSMESWRANGLLDIADERMLFLNSPDPEDFEIAREFDFDVYITDERGGNVKAGPSLAYLVGNSTADYVLLLEKDFVLSASRAVMMREMYTGVQHLARGVDGYRFRGKTDFPAEGMPDCCAAATPPNCPYHSNWRSAGYFGDHMNWLLIFCDPNILENSNGRLAQCTSEPQAPTSFCFTSGESNWSNNPILFGRTWFNDKIRDIALAGIDEANNMFEFQVMLSWLEWKPLAKICVSEQGIFTHNEIDQ